MKESKKQASQNSRTNAKSAQPKQVRATRAGSRRFTVPNELGETVSTSAIASLGITIATNEVPGAIFAQPRGAVVAKSVRTGAVEWTAVEFSCALRAGRFAIVRPCAAIQQRMASAGETGGDVLAELLASLTKEELAYLRNTTPLYRASEGEAQQYFIFLFGSLPAGSDVAQFQAARSALASALQKAGVDAQLCEMLDKVDIIYQSGDNLAIRMFDIFLRGLTSELEAMKAQAKGGAK